jgi:hypothetical protein
LKKLTHVLDNILSPVPEDNAEDNEDLVIFSLEFLMT